MAKTITKVGRYQIVSELGRGSMGVVYQGFDPVIGRTVAIKTMLTEGLGPEEFQEFKARFQREAQAAGLLSHPNILTVYDFGEDGGILYLVMEFLEGKSLQQIVTEQNILPIETVIPMYEQICSALDLAHSHKIVHRDMKPANIMILDSGLVKVTDFGIAKMMSLGMTRAGQILGTPNYMSPEQVKGGAVDGRSDIFSMGVILYELVTGEKPFGGQNITTVIYKIINENPIPPRELDPSVHMGLSYVISKSLTKSPDERYQSCRELAEDLRNYRNLGGTVQPAATVVVKRVPPMQPPQYQQPAQPQYQQQAPPQYQQPAPPQYQHQAPPQYQQPAPPQYQHQAPPQYQQPAPPQYQQPAPPQYQQPSYGYQQPAPPAYQPPQRPAYEYPPAPARPEPAAEPQPARPVSVTVIPPAKPAPARSSSAAAWIFLIILLAGGLGGGAYYFLVVQKSTQTPGPKNSGPTPNPTPPGRKVGTLSVAANLPGAKIWIDGQTKPDWITPHTFPNYAVGQHKVVVSKDGYTDASLTVDLAEGGTTPVSAQLLQAGKVPGPGPEERPPGPGPKPPATPGQLVVSANVEGARISIDGQSDPSWVTPHSFPEISAGTHQVTVSKEGYDSPTQTVTVESGQSAPVRFQLSQPSGEVNVVTVPPGADITIDGRPFGKSPVHAVLPVGVHTFTATQPGGEPHEGQLQITSGGILTRTVRWSATAPAATGIVEVRSDPPGATILADGESKGRTPQQIRLTAGRHILTISLQGYSSARREVDVPADGTVPVQVSLSPQ